MELDALSSKLTRIENEKSIGYWSRTFNPTAKKYYNPERECVQVVLDLHTPRPYLLYEKLTVFTCNSAPNWLMNTKEPSGRLNRLRLLPDE